MNDTITPVALAKHGNCVDATGVYDWQKQSYNYDSCKFGTYNTTRNGTSSYAGNMTIPTPDDSNVDNYSD